MKDLLIFPCNGNAVEALDCLGESYRLIGFVDDSEDKQRAGALGYPVFSRLALTRFREAQVLAVPGSPTSYRERRAAIDGLLVDPARFATVVHPSACISRSARIGRNVLIMAGVVLTSNAVISDHVCILPNAVVHHDAVVGPFALVGSNVTVAGGAVVGENCYVGSGTSVMNGVRIGRGALVGLGTTVVRDVPHDVKVVGNPGRVIS
jgi:sugar O-acyltransferase (sialic acid O-acetyltransferase NeuD family)